MSTKEEMQKELEEMYLEKAHTNEAIEYWEDRLDKCNARIVYLTTTLPHVTELDGLAKLIHPTTDPAKQPPGDRQ